MYPKTGFALLCILFAAPCNAQVNTLEGIGAGVMQNAPMPAPVPFNTQGVAMPAPVQAPAPVQMPNPVIMNTERGVYGSGDGQRPLTPTGPVGGLNQNPTPPSPAPYNPGTPVYSAPVSTFAAPNATPPHIGIQAVAPPQVVNPWHHPTLGYGPPANAVPPTYRRR
jgi:hypothetical protein